MAEEICVLYHEAVRAEVGAVTKGGRGHRMPSATLDDLDSTARESFMRAALAAIRLGADPREYVVAQFATWRAASAYHRTFLLPQPTHMCSLGAEIRYLQHKVREETRRSREVTLDEQDGRKRFYVEERQLRGLARASRRDPSDVLAEQPERFSRAFLEHVGVWGAVKDLWEERRQT